MLALKWICERRYCWAFEVFTERRNKYIHIPRLEETVLHDYRSFRLHINHCNAIINAIRYPQTYPAQTIQQTQVFNQLREYISSE